MNPVSGNSNGGLQQVLALRQQVLEQSQALRELRETGAPATNESAPTRPAGSGFAATLDAALDQVNAAQARSSEISAAYERGEVTDIAQVMMARQESGIAFEATLQMRNRLLTAYQEIMRMGV